jgi:hypothetical protein
MERAVELQWREIVAHLDDAPAPPDDNAFAHWALALGVMGLIPLAAPELLLAALPFAAGALLLGALGLRRAASIGRGRTRSGIALLLGAAPVATVFLIGALALVLVAP